MNFTKQFYALIFFAMLSTSLTAVADEETEEVLVMEEVLVTARKREQRSFEVPLSVSTIQGDKSDALRSSGMDVRFFVEPHPQFTDRVLVWAYFSTLLYPRPRQYRLRSQRFTTRVSSLRRGRP